MTLLHYVTIITSTTLKKHYSNFAELKNYKTRLQPEQTLENAQTFNQEGQLLESLYINNHSTI